MKAWSLLLSLLVCMPRPGAHAMSPAGGSVMTPSGAPPVRHVFVIVLENEPYPTTFGEHSPAPFLAYELTKQGALLDQYFGIGHYSLDNYVAMISGQAPNSGTQADCPIYSEFNRNAPGLDPNGQALGEGCIYPADVKTLANQLDAATFSWRGYMEDMGADPARESAGCGHVAVGAPDNTNHAAANDQYADKHNPFVYFHSIIDDANYCSRHVVNLDHLVGDLQSVRTTPNLAFITPNLCHDGHDVPCKNGETGGLVSADAFLRVWVPRILASPAFRRDGLLVITFDEGTDALDCCDEQGLPGGPAPGRFGPGGGRVGAVVLSPFIAPGTLSSTPYNHYSLLRTIEDFFGLPHLGYAAAPRLQSLGNDVFKRMIPAGKGAILLTGATAGVKGFALSAPFAMGKFALRGLASPNPMSTCCASIAVPGLGSSRSDRGWKPFDPWIGGLRAIGFTLALRHPPPPTRGPRSTPIRD